MTAGRRNALVSSIISHAAQLAYVEEARGAYELLSSADRFLRRLDGRGGPVPLESELETLALYAEILNLCAPRSVELAPFLTPADPAGSGGFGASALVERNALVDALAGLLEGQAGGQSDLRMEEDKPVFVSISRLEVGSYLLAAGSRMVTVVPASVPLSTRTTGSP